MSTSTTPETLTINVQEDILSSNAPTMLSEWQESLEGRGDATAVCLEISKVGMIDSQGLNLIIGFYKECMSQKLGFSIAGSSSENKRLFSIFKLTQTLNVQ